MKTIAKDSMATVTDHTSPFYQMDLKILAESIVQRRPDDRCYLAEHPGLGSILTIYASQVRTRGFAGFSDGIFTGALA